MNERAIFDAALDIDDPTARAAYLDRVCDGNPALRQHLAELLSAQDNLGSFLAGPPVLSFNPTMDEPSREDSGTVVGPYQLLEPLGEGGMGTVWLAQQSEPVKRLVALKVIKPGMDSRQIIARFEAERQALALMDHPNIAKVLDGGETASGRPYFVMELVKGVPITRYCDEYRLPPRWRLELFLPVCQAIQHAHTKGIIHRDIKPSNVLVALYDGQPVVKVIDFGVAKALHQPLMEASLDTAVGQVVGTPQYMSPEQAELNQPDIDTRSDIYSLGVLLYELLTGTTPLERQRLQGAALLEVLRVIREEETPSPSARLNTVEELSAIAASRGLEPKQLRGVVRGELDWIVLKALEKDRTRRYETASAFAADVQRYLQDETVLACPPSAGYRVRKFVRRNRRALATATLVGVMLLAALAVVGGTIGWATRDRAAREQEQERERLTRLSKASAGGQEALQDAQRLRTQARWREARAAVKRAQMLLGGSADAAHQLQAQHLLADLNMAEAVEAIRLDRSAVRDEHFDNETADLAYAHAFRGFGIDVNRLPAEEAAKHIRGRTIHAELVAALDDWALVRRILEKPDATAWKRLLAVARAADTDAQRNRLRDVLETEDGETVKKLAASMPPASLTGPTVMLLADALKLIGARAEALATLERAQQHHPADFWINNHLGLNLFYARQWGKAIRYFTAAAALRPDSPGVFVNLGGALREQGDLDGAIAAGQRAVDLKPDYANAHNNLGAALGAKGRLAESITHLQQAIALQPRDAAPHFNLGRTLQLQHKYKEAIACYRKAIDLKPSMFLPRYYLGSALFDQGHYAEAEEAYLQAIDVNPKDDAAAFSALGVALGRLNKLEQARAAFRKAMELQPKNPVWEYNLGSLLREHGQFSEAIACFRKAIELDPKYGHAWGNLGLALEGLGRFAEAADAHRKAVEFATDKDSAYRAYNNLGGALGRLDREPEAADCFRKALESQPDLSEAYYGLGLALGNLGKHQEAIPGFRKAVERKPDHYQAWGSLGFALHLEGEFSEALAAYQRCLDLLPADHPTRAALEPHRASCARLRALADRLPAILNGLVPADPAERAQFAEVCAAKKLFGAAARFYQHAFQEQPALAADLKVGRRFDAARAATQAGCGQGKDQASLSDEQRAVWRKQALAWLRADLTLLEQESNTPSGRAFAIKKLLLWQRTPAFDSLRAEATFAALPKAEQGAWRGFWADVEGVLARLKSDGKVRPG